jgi:hypothetical protein
MQQTLVAGKGFHVGKNGAFLALMAVVIAAVAATAMLALRQHGPGRSMVPEVRAQPVPNGLTDEVRIDSVTPILPQPRQKIVIKGIGFGLHVRYFRTDSPYLSIRDKTLGWAAGRLIPQNWDAVMVDVESWTDTEIVVSGFSGDYGRNGWKLNPGDMVEVAVWNPQSGVGPALYRVKVSPNAP